MVSFKGLIGASYCQERSVSPEKLTKLFNGRIHFYPIKGISVRSMNQISKNWM